MTNNRPEQSRRYFYTRKENAEFRDEAGLKTYLVRQTNGKCCDWCASLAGRYLYEDAPEDVFAKHDNCTCTVEYITDRYRENVHTKKRYALSQRERSEILKNTPKPTRFTKEQAQDLQNNVLNGVANSGNGGIIKVEGMYRKTANTGAFEVLPERMSKKHIRQVAAEFGIDLAGIKLNIDFNEELLRIPYSGRADPEKIGSITFFPNSFRSKEELARTIFHERLHTKQFKEYGAEYVQNHREYFEKITEKEEELFVARMKEEGRL